MSEPEQPKSAEIHKLHVPKPVHGHGEIDPTEEMLIDHMAETANSAGGPMTDAEYELQMRAILGADWKAPVDVQAAERFFALSGKAVDDEVGPYIGRAPAGWLICGSFEGVDFAGCRQDGIGLAHDWVAMVRRTPFAGEGSPQNEIEQFSNEGAMIGSGNPDQPRQNADAENEGGSEDVRDEVEHAAAPYVDLDALKEALRLRILAEAVRRSGMSMELFERINAVHAVINDENASAAAKNDAELELQMHGVWSERAKVIDAAKTQKLVEVMGLETLDDINAYDVNAGWP